jgi:hypothetical protein
MTLATELTFNSIIYVEAQSGMVFDPDRGHDVPAYAVTEVIAFLEIDNRTKAGDRYVQKEAPFQQQIKGFADLPICANVKVNHRAKISGVDGRMFFDPIPQEASIYHYDLSDLTGYPVEGYFVPGAE